MDLTKTQLIYSVFAGGGEMGARMHACTVNDVNLSMVTLMCTSAS
jgi:hypothetical protein